MKNKGKTTEKYEFAVILIGLLGGPAVIMPITYVWSGVALVLGFLLSVFIFYLYLVGNHNNGNSNRYNNGGDVASQHFVGKSTF